MSSEKDDPQLDFLSPAFDPVKALQTSPSKVVLPHPSVQPCDNLQAYTSVVQGRRQVPRPHTTATALTPVHSLEERQKGGKEEASKKKSTKTVFDFMERENPGPFSLLQTCRCAGRRVKVTIRHCAGVRGMCEGVPVVYDRHMNIVLRDVTEWCTPIRTVANGGITLSKSKRQRKKKRTEQSSKERSGELNEGHSEGNIEQDTSLHGETAISPQSEEGSETRIPGEVTERHKEMDKWEVFRTVKQLFIRGDNIILITPI